MLRIATALLAALAFAAPAQAQIQNGTYALEIAFGGGILEGSLEITTPRRDSLAITLMVGGHQSPVRLTRRQGNTIVLESTVPGMQIRYELEFRGDTVTGPFMYDGNEGRVSGRRRS